MPFNHGKEIKLASPWGGLGLPATPSGRELETDPGEWVQCRQQMETQVRAAGALAIPL